jgi:hypothetical protein
MICKVDFTFWNRKHHCRRCGAVVCFACSGSRTKFIYKEITPEKVAPEEMRVCDSCIQVIDEKLAEGMHRRLHNNNNNNSEENQEQSNASSSGNNTDEQEASFLSHEQRQKQNQEDKAGGRAVLTHGRYRYVCHSILPTVY